MRRPLQLPTASSQRGSVRKVGPLRGIRPVRWVGLIAAATLGAALFLVWLARDATTPPSSPHPSLQNSGSTLSALRTPLSASAPSRSALRSQLSAHSAPSDPIARAERLAVAEPERSREFAYDAIATLHASGRAADAAAFALRSTLGPRRDLVIAAYFEWAGRESETALAAAFQVSEPAAREFAVEAVFSGWAKRDPAGLAEFARTLPAGPERTRALTKALRYWSLRDPDRAAQWISSHEELALPAAELALRRD